VDIGGGSVTTSSADINGGTIDSTPIGNASRSTGKFTTLDATSAVSAPSLLINSLDLTPEIGTWTFRITDNAGTGSLTSVTGNYMVIGDLVFCSAVNYLNIDNSALTGTDDLRCTLPFTARAGFAGSGNVAMGNLNSWPGRPDSTLIVNVTPGSSFARIVSVGDDLGPSVNMKVQDIADNVTDITLFTATYVRA